MTERIRLAAYGVVQGVGFRYFVRNAARDAGILAGWVRNRADGAVEMEAEADATALGAFRESVRRGPPHATVHRLDDLPTGDEPLPRPFTIRH